MWPLFKKILFSMDPEMAHKIAMSAISLGLFHSKPPKDPRLPTQFLNTTIAHPIGLAAGFDKDGSALDEWQNFGFSFVEAGTVTPVAQSGNDKPRLFRLLEDEALINRMGFNNNGADALRHKLESKQTQILVGANIGKNKSTANENAQNDYALCAKIIGESANFVTINVSSPNTPGLRSLQSSEELKKIINATQTNKPIFIKVSPDLNDDDLESTVRTSLNEGAVGIIATNTTIRRESLLSVFQNELGGLSGKPLTQIANNVCKKVRQIAGDKPIIIGVGGIMTGDDLYERLLSGANVCQIYTAFVYRGPHAVSQILCEYLVRLDKEAN